MASASSDKILKKLIETNIKSHESVSSLVMTVKEFISELKRVGEGTEEINTATKDDIRAIHNKLDQLLRAITDLTQVLKGQARQAPPPSFGQQYPATPPPPPPEWRRL